MIIRSILFHHSINLVSVNFEVNWSGQSGVARCECVSQVCLLRAKTTYFEVWSNRRGSSKIWIKIVQESLFTRMMRYLFLWSKYEFLSNLKTDNRENSIYWRLEFGLKNNEYSENFTIKEYLDTVFSWKQRGLEIRD